MAAHKNKAAMNAASGHPAEDHLAGGSALLEMLYGDLVVPRKMAMLVRGAGDQGRRPHCMYSLAKSTVHMVSCIYIHSYM